VRQIIHILSEYTGCRKNRELFTDIEQLLVELDQRVKASGLCTVAQAGHSFGEGEGVTASVVLAESHLNIHTWPERDYYLNLDISVCNYTADNFPKALELEKSIKQMFDPIDVNQKTIKGYKDFEDDKYTEYFSPDYGFFIKPKQVHYRSAEEFQTIEVYETRDFGKLLRIDNFFQTSDADEAHYHEPLVHPAMIAHPDPQNVLIIGAGDGGVLKNVLGYKNVKKAVMVEIDDKVIQVAKEFLPKIHGGAFEDPRAEIVIQDGFKYIEETANRFDVVLLDLTDPIGPAKALYTDYFYRKIKGVLKNEDSILALHTEYPRHYPNIYGRINQTLKGIFSEVSNGFSYVPIYGATMGFAYCSDRSNPKTMSLEDVESRLAERQTRTLELYNGETHFGYLAEPNYVKDILKQSHEVITAERGLDDFMDTYNVTRS